jgi:hypothetical protein
MASSKQPRRERRAASRKALKEAELCRKLFRAAAGGAPTFPLPVASASIIEARAQAIPCPVCQGACRVVSHTATIQAAKRLRVVTLQCQSCSEQCQVYFEILMPN